jgi:hypothetical protein
MADGDDREARVFTVETRFQKLARQPGGVSREKALENAAAKIEEIVPSFDDWVGQELDALSSLIKKAQAGDAPPDWIEGSNAHSRQIRDAGTTMGSELLTFVASSLCDVLDAIEAGAECNMESITCHIDALFLARQRQFRGMKPEQVPELTRGLRRVVEVVSTTPN